MGWWSGSSDLIVGKTYRFKMIVAALGISGTQMVYDAYEDTTVRERDTLESVKANLESGIIAKWQREDRRMRRADFKVIEFSYSAI